MSFQRSTTVYAVPPIKITTNGESDEKYVKIVTDFMCSSNVARGKGEERSLIAYKATWRVRSSREELIFITHT